MIETMNLDNVTCECCGVPARMQALTVTFGHEETTILCPTCERMIDAGLLRPEMVDGRLRYRQWHFEPMTPGDLLPDPSSRGASQ